MAKGVESKADWNILKKCQHRELKGNYLYLASINSKVQEINNEVLAKFRDKMLGMRSNTEPPIETHLSKV